MTTTRTGLTMASDASSVAPPVHDGLRLTIPVREALEAAGNIVQRLLGDQGEDTGRYIVTMRGTVPRDLVLCLIGGRDYRQREEQVRGLRLQIEPEYPDEWQDSAIAWWERGNWVPCPACRAPLVWYEAGYVSGYRVCARAPHHHATLSSDGRSAKLVRR
jgi:hypothetical protein